MEGTSDEAKESPLLVSVPTHPQKPLTRQQEENHSEVSLSVIDAAEHGHSAASGR